jgi:hypothetical protein
MNFSKLAFAAITALVTLPLSACAVAPEGSDGAGAGERSAESCLPFCVIQYPKIVHSEWYTYQIKTHDTNTGTNVTLPLNGRHAVLNADHSKVAFAGTDGNIYIANASDGSGSLKLTSAGVFDYPAFSPDKSTLVFASVGTAGYGANIYKVAATGGAVSKLTSNPGDWYFDPQFLDADTVVFQVGLNGSASFALVQTTALNQSSFSYLSGVPNGMGELSVSGSHVAFTKEAGSCGQEAVVVGTVSGTTVSGLHELICTSWAGSHDPSVVGGTVAFEWGQNYGTQYIYTMPFAGGSTTYQGISSSDPMDMSMR